MRYEEVVVFTVGLMADPSGLIDYVYNMFNRFNLKYIRDWNLPLHEQTEKRLNDLGLLSILISSSFCIQSQKLLFREHHFRTNTVIGSNMIAKK